MTILSIAASGIVVAAAAVFAFSVVAPRNAAPAEPPAPSPHRRADQRGITLQTLIIMAVLVLVATGVSVVLVGITRGANDGLENAGQVSSEAKCEPWEIYDEGYAASGLGGIYSKGGVRSSGIGCIRACFLRLGPGQNPNYADSDILKVLTYEDEAARRPPDLESKDYFSLEFYRGEDKLSTPTTADVDPLPPLPIFSEGIFPVVSHQEYEPNPPIIIIGIENFFPPLSIDEVIPNPSLESDPIPIGDLEIRVASDLRSCVLWDPATGKEIFRSQGTI